MSSARMIRRGLLRSARWNDMPIDAREFFFRFMLAVDDYGIFTADYRLVCSACYPFGGQTAEGVQGFIEQLESLDMVYRSTCPKGADYFVIKSFAQKLRRMSCDYPIDLVSGVPAVCNQSPDTVRTKSCLREGKGREGMRRDVEEKEPPTTTTASKNIESELSKSDLYGKYVEYYTEFLLIPGCGRVSIEGFTRACIANPDADFAKCLEDFRTATDGENVKSALRYFTGFLNRSDGEYKASQVVYSDDDPM